jgi:formate hydrogenlyase subunit 3/multisubunit Na+/H+ antiporter MnhD subunit
MPASAVLSGAVVKAGIIGLIRFLAVDPALADVGTLLAIAGMFTALYAVAVGVTQPHPKVVLAYSSVSQMGFVAAVIGMGVANADAAAPVLAAFYASHHILVKGAMFLLVGVVAASSLGRIRGSLLLAAVIAVGLGGLPLTGGFIAKAAVKGPLGDGWATTVAAASAAGTTLLMLHFLRRVRTVCMNDDEAARAGTGLLRPWLAMAVASIVLPWVLYLALPLGTLGEAFAPKTLWAAVLPVAVGALLAFGLARGADRLLPRIPEGDVAIAIDAGVRGFVAVTPAAVAADRGLRQWSFATVLLLATAIALGLSMAAAG